MWKNNPPFRLALNRAASDEIARHCKHCTERGVTKLHESGTALAEGMRVHVSKMEESIAAHCQTSLKTVKDPDRGPYPAYPSGKSWCEACGKMGSGQKFYHSVNPGADFTARGFTTTSLRDPISQRVDGDTVDPGWDDEFMDNAFVFVRHVHGGQLQLHRNKGDLQRFELHCEQLPRKCHGIQRCVRRRRANSDVGSGTATRVYRH